MTTRLRWLLITVLSAPVTLLLDREPHADPPHRAEWLTAGGVRLRTLRAGQGDTTLMLLHGYGEHLMTWRSVIDPLARHHHVVAVDLPGFGGSEKPAVPYTLGQMAAWIDDFARRWVPGPLILVGHSLGGAVAAQVALSHPGQVVALVLIAPAGLEVGLDGITEGMTPNRANLIGWYEAARSFVTPLHDPGWLEEPEPERSYEPASDPAYRLTAARVLNEFDFEGIGDRFRALAQPVLLIWGRLDPVIPYQTGARLSALLPCARLATLDGALHRPQAEQPDTVIRLIEGFARRPDCQ